MNHWGTLFEYSTQRAIECLRETAQNGDVRNVSETRKEHNRTHPQEPAFLAFEHPNTPVRYLAVCRTNPSEKRLELVTGYPFLAQGEKVVFELLDVLPEEGEIEGTIECVSRCGETRSFFEPLMCYDKDEMRIGQRYEFLVAGIAYSLEHLANPEFTITSGPAVELERQRILSEDPNADVSDVTSGTISTAEMRCLINRDTPGDAEFQTVVDEVSSFDLNGETIWRMRCSFLECDESRWPFAIFASQWVLQGYCPKPGDVVRGVMWMQAYPINEVETKESWIDSHSAHEAKVGGLLESFLTDNPFAGLPPGVAATGSSLQRAGWEVTRYAPDSGDIPDFLVERNRRKINVWVDAYDADSERIEKFPVGRRKELDQLSHDRGEESAFVTVRCRTVENYRYFDFEDKERLIEFFGETPFILAERIPGSDES